MPPDRPPAARPGRPRVRSSAVEAATVRRLAARRAASPAKPRAEPPAAKPPAAEPPAEPPAESAATAASDPDVHDVTEQHAETVAEEHAETVAEEHAETVPEENTQAAGADADSREETGAWWERLGPFGKMPFVLAVVTVLLGALAAWFGTEAGSLTGTPSARNQALTDPAATSAVSGQIGNAVSALFSYDYAAPDPTAQAARRLLTGAAVRQYASLFGQVRKEALGQKLVITTTVSNIGVEFLAGQQARVLVFAVETLRKGGSSTPSTAGAMLAVNAVRVAGAWKIEGIDTFG